MAEKDQRDAGTLIDRVREAAERLAEALTEALRGPAPEPAVARVRQPTPEEVRRYIRQRRGY